MNCGLVVEAVATIRKWEKLNEYSFDTDHSMISGVYSGLYSIIYKANLIIQLMDLIRR